MVLSSKSQPVLWLVIPCYNEEDVLPHTAPLFLETLEGMVSDSMISDSSKTCFVNDGSKDKTWDIIRNLSEANPFYCGVSLSKNRGHQNALFTGLMEAREHCDICISIDCDGQDDISAARIMVEEYLTGCDIVYGVRSNRSTDTFFKRFTGELLQSPQRHGSRSRV